MKPADEHGSPLCVSKYWMRHWIGYRKLRNYCSLAVFCIFRASWSDPKEITGGPLSHFYTQSFAAVPGVEECQQPKQGLQVSSLVTLHFHGSAPTLTPGHNEADIPRVCVVLPLMTNTISNSVCFSEVIVHKNTAGSCVTVTFIHSIESVLDVWMPAWCLWVCLLALPKEILK